MRFNQFMKRTVLLITIVILLNGCASPFAPIIIAPEDVPLISSPQELPEQLRKELQGIKIPWYKSIISPATGQRIEWPTELPKPISDIVISPDGRYLIYMRARGMGRDQIQRFDFETRTIETLVDMAEVFPGGVIFNALSLSPDGQTLIFNLFWPDGVDLVKLDLASIQWHRFRLDIAPDFGVTDISPKNQVILRCGKVSGNRPVNELCLLDDNGQFIRYLTNENYFAIGYGKFSPDGEWVIYESRYKLYRVRIDGSGRQEIAVCAEAGPTEVTDHYALIRCNVTQEPRCLGLFAASLDGEDFWKLGYVDQYCIEE